MSTKLRWDEGSVSLHQSKRRANQEKVSPAEITVDVSDVFQSLAWISDLTERSVKGHKSQQQQLSQINMKCKMWLISFSFFRCFKQEMGAKIWNDLKFSPRSKIYIQAQMFTPPKYLFVTTVVIRGDSVEVLLNVCTWTWKKSLHKKAPDRRRPCDMV